MTESDFKRAIVRQILLEGGFARRIEDKFAVGSLDMLIVTQRHTIYAEGKILKDVAALPASVAQRHQIKIFNDVGNPRARALVVALKSGHIGFGLPGQRWDSHYTARWPITNEITLCGMFDYAVEQIFGRITEAA